jgi:hypothetical protein
MRFKLTILLLALNAALAGLIFYFDKVQSTRGLIDESSRLVLNPDFVRGLDRISILSQASPDAWTLERQGDRWLVTSPFQWKANPFAVEQLLFQLHRLGWESRFPVAELQASGQSLDSYNLDSPPLRLQLHSGTQSLTLALGNPTEIGNRLYLLSTDGDFVLVARRGILDLLQRESEALLDRKLFHLTLEETRAVQIQDRSAGNLRVRLARERGAWRFVSPIEAAADAERVRALLLDWQNLEVEGFETGVELPTGMEANQLRLTLEGLSERETLIISPSEGSTYLARRDAFPTVFRISAQKVEALRSAQEDLRERRILAQFSADWTTLQIQFGDLGVTLQQLENGAWQVLYTDADNQLRSLPADPDAIARMQEFLRTLEAERFITDAPSEGDLARFGLTEPQRRVRLRIGNQWAAEFVVGDLHPETGQTLLFAKTNLSDSVFLVRPHVLPILSLDPFQYRERTLRSVPDSARISEVALIHRISGLPLPLEDIEGAAEDEIRDALRSFLREIRVERFLNRPFADPLPLDQDRQVEWPYLLEGLVSYPEDPDREPARIRLFVSERLGGTTHYIGDPESGLAGTLPHRLIEVLEMVLARYPEEPAAAQPVPEPAAEAPVPEPAAEAPVPEPDAEADPQP